MANLREKRLKGLTPDTKVEITRNDAERSKFVGVVSDNDFEESLEVKGDFGELIIMYDEIASFIVLQKDATDSASTPAPSFTPGIIKTEASVVPERPYVIPKRMEDLCFYSKVEFPIPTDADLDAYFKNELTDPDKNLAKNAYQSFKYKLRNRETSACSDAVAKLLKDLDGAQFEPSEKAYRFTLLLQLRAGCALDYATMIYTESYDFMALYYYKKKDTFRAAVSACLAIVNGCDEFLKNIVYTVFAKTSCELADFSGIAYILIYLPQAEKQEEIFDLLNYVYAKNQMRYSSGLDVNRVVPELDAISKVRKIEPAVRKQLESNEKDRFEEFTNQQISVEKQPVKAPGTVKAPVQKDKSAVPEIKKGEIFMIYWGDDKGKILSDDKEYNFEYANVADKALLNKLKKLMTRDLRAINSTFPVEFSLLNGKVSNIKGRKVPPKKEPISTPPKESSLMKARHILSDSNNPNRSEESLPWLEKAFEEEANPLTPLTEYIICCMTVANHKKDESYNEKAYNMYLRFENQIASLTGPAINAPLMDLLVKMKRTDEAIATAGRILADPKISVEIRMSYIYSRAKQLMEKAASVEALETSSREEIQAAYERAMAAFTDWGQRFSDTPSFRKDLNKNQLYYNAVLLGIANCHIKLGKAEEAKNELKKILAFDASNGTARNLLQTLLTADLDQKDADADSRAQGEDESAYDVWEDDYYDVLDEDQLQYEEYKDVSGWKALNLTEEDVVAYVLKLIADGKVAPAVAYLKAASDLNDKLVPTYTMFSYAVNHPLDNFDYRMENISLQYDPGRFQTEIWMKYAQASAVLRGSFYHSSENDYFVGSAYLDQEILTTIPALEKAMEVIEAFRTDTGKGMDLYADYRHQSEDSKKAVFLKLSKDAGDLHDRYYGRVYRDSAMNGRFKRTKESIFETNGFIEQLLNCVSENNTELFKPLQAQFVKMFIKDGFAVSSDNIDYKKIDAFIDDAWDNSKRRKTDRISSTLIGSLRNNVKIPLLRITALVCSWLSLNKELDDGFSESELARYRSGRTALLETLSQAREEIESMRTGSDDVQEKAGLILLDNTVAEVIERISGTWSEENRRYFFADFLRTDNILLNDDFLPDLTFTLCDMPSFNVLSRIRAHAEDTDADMVEYAKTIYSRAEEKHDFGTAEKISSYLNYLNRGTEWALPENAEMLDEQARKQLRERYDRFNDDIGSARSRGQLDTSDEFLRTINATAQSLYQYCLETKNYGFFVRFVTIFMDAVHENALEYGFVLKARLARLSEKFSWDEDIYNTISTHIEAQQFTVAEELMYRVENGDFEGGSGIPKETVEYMTQFWNEFDANYSTIARDRGNSLVKIISTHGAMKDRRGGEALVNNWPRGDRCSCEQISTLLRFLGWSGITVEPGNITGNLTSFKVKESVKLFSQREYAHPIAAFGTQTYPDGFYVVCLFGTTDSARLIDICKRLDSINGNKLILVDFALSSGERRKLARLMKQVRFANTYMFIDRVSLLFLANHYVGGVANANHRALFAISLPFTYYQPYGTSSSTATAPELFSGRKDELLSVEKPDGANLIYGGRQLGKTAILNKAVNEIHDPENGRYAFRIDIKDRDCKESAHLVSHWLHTEGIFSENQLTDDWEMLAIYLRRSIIDKSISYLLLMLDEADCFIEDCRSVDYAPFVALKDIQQSTNGRFKFVLAGLHNIVKFKREVALGKNSVIAHLSYINVKPFDFETAKKLLSEPLSYLGFDFADDDVAFMQICAATNYYPGLLQLFCHNLIENLKKNYGGYNESDTPGYKVTMRHIGKVLSDKAFMDAIKLKFEITLRVMGDNSYFILALLLALLYDEKETPEGYNVDDIIGIADSIGIDLLKKYDRDDVESLLEELCDLNILKSIDSHYMFRTKSFRDLLGSKTDLEEQLLKMI